MTATTPLWVTVLLAVLAPALTLIGVLWTQRAADKRAEREATQRLDHEVAVMAFNRRLIVYGELFDIIQPYLVSNSVSPAEEARLHSDEFVRARLVGSPDLVDGIRTFIEALQAEQAEGSTANRESVHRYVTNLIDIMRREIGADRLDPG